MRWQDEYTPEEQAVKDAAQAEFNRLVSLRNALGRVGEDHPAQQAVHAAYEALGRADIGYFRLNIWGMSETRPWLLKVGAAHERGNEPRDWPSEDDFAGGYEDPAYEAACDRVRAAGVEFPGIPIWKLGSNDWWHVTPIECRSAVIEAAKHEDELTDAPEYVREFLVWIGEAALRGGFRVG